MPNWGKIGQTLLRIADAAAPRLAAIGGNYEPLKLQRQRRLDERQQQMDELAAQEQEAQLASRSLQDELMRKQLSAFETPEQRDARELKAKRAEIEQGLALSPPTTIQQGNRILERRYDPESKQFVTGDPLQVQPPISVPMGGHRESSRLLQPPEPLAQGQLEQSNVNLRNRPIVKNPLGGNSTLFSMSFGEDGREILVPRVSDDGRILSEDEAIDNYRNTGKHLGVFRSPNDATAFSQQLSKDSASGKFSQKLDTETINLPIRDSVLQPPPQRQPMLLSPRIQSWQNVRQPDGSVARVGFDAAGNRVEGTEALAPTAFYENAPVTTVRTDAMGATTTSTRTGGGKLLSSSQPPAQPTPQSSPTSPAAGGPQGNGALDAAVDAISRGAADLNAYPQKRTRPTDPPSKDEIIRRAQERGVPLLGKEGRTMQQDFIAAEESMNTFENALNDFNNASWFSPMQKALAGVVMKNEANALSRLIGRALGEQRFTDEDKRDFVNVLGPSLILNTVDPAIAKRQIADIRSTMAKIKERKLATFNAGQVTGGPVNLNPPAGKPRFIRQADGSYIEQ